MSNLELLGHLKLRVDQGSFPAGTNGGITIQEADVYSAAPADLVGGTGDGSTRYYFSPANYRKSGKRKRKVGGAGGDKCCWHPERRSEILRDGKPAGGYARHLSYVTKTPGSATKRKSSGWCMIEIALEQQQQRDGADQIVLCKVYKSNQADQGTASISAGAAADHQAVSAPVGQRPAISLQPDGPGISEEAQDGQHDSAALDLPVGDSDSDISRELAAPPDGGKAATVVMKFGGSSIASPEKMKEVAELVLSLDAAGERPLVVLSAMGETTNNLILASEAAISCDIQQARLIYEHSVVMELHLKTIKELGLDKSVVSGSLEELAKLLDFVAMTSELTPMTRHYLISLGERMSAAILSAYLNELGRRARQVQFLAFDVDSEDFSNVDILEATYPVISKKLQGDWIDDPAIPIVTSFVGKVRKSGAFTTLGSDLTAAIIGEALGLGEIQGVPVGSWVAPEKSNTDIWKDVDGVLTGDPNICANAILVPCLTFDEATELANAGAQVLNSRSMRLAMRGGIPIIIKNICNPGAPGTMITQTRDMSKSILISIVVKSNIFMLDIKSKRMPGRCDFQAQVFSIFKDSSISIDYEANRGDNISLTLYPSKLYGPELMQQELDNVVEELEKIAVVHRRELKSIISLIGNVQKSSFMVGKALTALAGIGVNVQKISQSWPKNQVLSVSLVVADCEARRCAQVLHSEFLEDGFLPKVDGAENEWPPPVNNSSARRGRSRQSDDGFPESAPGVRQARTDAVPIAPELEEIERSLMSDINDDFMDTDTAVPPLPVGVEKEDPIPVGDGDPTEFFAGVVDDNLTPVRVDDDRVMARMITPDVGDNFMLPIGADDEGGSFSAGVLPDADDDLAPVEFDDGGFIPAGAWLVDGEAQQQGLDLDAEAGGGLDLDALLAGVDIDELLGPAAAV